MKLSYIYSFGNKGNTLVAQNISTNCLPHQANTHNTPQYLTPDYFLPASCSESYYSKKYSCNKATNARSIGTKPIYQSKFRKISRVASVIMLSLGFLATALEVKTQPDIEPNQSFLFGKGSAGISTGGIEGGGR